VEHTLHGAADKELQMRHVLITGGAGFIGSHLADALIARGDRVRVLDSLDPQVHGVTDRPLYLHDAVELRIGDVRDRAAVDAALAGVDAVVHLAAAVGVGQSMYAVEKYTSVNALGTAVLLEALAERRVQRLVVASSMSVYGEGRYVTEDGEVADACTRNLDMLRRGEWDPRDQEGRPLQPVPTPETKQPILESVYALGKYDQERLCLLLGRAYGIPTIALRFFNVYGPRQALSNPYTGVLAIFASRLMNERPPLIFEDGLQQRDFVNVADVVRGIVLAIDRTDVSDDVVNIGSGEPRTVRDITRSLADALNSDVAPDVTAQYRVGDIRHCFADISKAKALLGYQPQVSLDAGMRELTGWLASQQAEDRVSEAHRELVSRGLAV
jgi:dTDP-L-rhamnose 4-epimerase